MKICQEINDIWVWIFVDGPCFARCVMQSTSIVKVNHAILLRILFYWSSQVPLLDSIKVDHLHKHESICKRVHSQFHHLCLREWRTRPIGESHGKVSVFILSSVFFDCRPKTNLSFKVSRLVNDNRSDIQTVALVVQASQFRRRLTDVDPSS